MMEIKISDPFIVGSLAIFYLIFLYLIHTIYDRLYRKKFKQYTDELQKEYIKCIKKVKQQALIDAINIKNSDLLDKCPYCGKEIKPNENSV